MDDSNVFTLRPVSRKYTGPVHPYFIPYVEKKTARMATMQRGGQNTYFNDLAIMLHRISMGGYADLEVVRHDLFIAAGKAGMQLLEVERSWELAKCGAELEGAYSVPGGLMSVTRGEQ